MACSKVCDKCGLMAENFKSVREFKKHFQKHGDPVSCPQCEKLFPTRIRMQAHVSRYHKESSVTCEECSKSFSSKDSLTQHSKYHKICYFLQDHQQGVQCFFHKQVSHHSVTP